MTEHSIAVVAGQPVTETPKDLFIPPDALEVLLDSFTGPLDLLLYLIRRQNIDIMDIPILRITQQYMQYIELMEEQRMALAADYLVMAAVLAEIKSQLLLPINTLDEDGIEVDPRMELVRRLQIYEQFKHASGLIDALPRYDRDVFAVEIGYEQMMVKKSEPILHLETLAHAMMKLLERQTHSIHHQIKRESLSVRERMSIILLRLQSENLLELGCLFTQQEGRLGLIVSLLAALELAKQSLISVTQTVVFAPVYIQSVITVEEKCPSS